MRGENAAVDQQRLGRSANAGAAHFGVQHQRARFGEIGLRVHIGVADAFEMREHRHARFRLHARDQTSAAARHDQIDGAGEPGENHAHRGAIDRRDHLNGCFRQTRFTQTFRQRRMNGGRRVRRFRAAAQNRGVARF